MRKTLSKYVSVFVLLLVGQPCSLLAQFQQQSQPEEKELVPVSGTYAITNANITQAPGRKIDKGTVVVKDGLIVSVGKDIKPPADAIIIKGDSLFLYAGFIDGLSRTGVTKPKEEQGASRERPKDPGNPTPEAAGITPQNDVRLSLNPADKTVEDLRAIGFGTVQSVPYGGMFPGAASIVLLTGKDADEMVLVGRSAMAAELASAQRVYPNTVIAVMAKFREMYRQAQQAKTYESMYASNRAGLNRPPSDKLLEALYPVIDKQLPVAFKAEKYLESQRILALQNEFGFPLQIADLKEGWDAIARLKAANTKVFLSLDLPEDKNFEKKADAKGDKKEGDKKESDKKDDKPSKPDPEHDALEKRKTDAIKMYTSQAAEFQKAGVTFGFSAFTVKTSDIQKNLRRMIAAGLTEDQALAALTTNAALLLGLSDRLGTVDAGKIANLVLSDKPYFNEKAKVRYVFVDGVMYKYETKEAPKAEVSVINITGTWSMTTDTPEGKKDEKVTFTKDGNTYTGSISGGRFQQAAPLETVDLNGTRLKFSYTIQAEGQSVKVDVEVTIEGDSFKGSATSGRFGSTAVEGKKDPNK
jgi:imidazolonepropionase-like amidohydrolase